MKPVINTEKHMVQISLSTVASGAITNLVFATAVSNPTAVPSEIREGCIIKAIYLELWITSDDAGSGTSIVTLERVNGATTTLMTTAESAALNNYDNKKNVLHTQMGLTPSNVQYPQASLMGWFKIPKGKQRFGLNDRIVVNVHGQSNGLQMCGHGIFKEQY